MKFRFMYKLNAQLQLLVIIRIYEEVDLLGTYSRGVIMPGLCLVLLWVLGPHCIV